MTNQIPDAEANASTLRNVGSSDGLRSVVAALTRVAAQVASDPRYKEELRNNPVAAAQAAGISVAVLAALAGDGLISGRDLVRFTHTLGDLPDTGGWPVEMRVSNMCWGTCGKNTFWLCGGCDISAPAVA